MLFSNHVAAGIILTKAGLNPEIVLPLCFVSHFALDSLPHTDVGVLIAKDKEKNFVPANIKEWIYLLLDIFGGLILFMIAFLQSPNYLISLAVFLAILPDLLDNLPFWNLKNILIFKQLHFLHEYVHFNVPKSKWFFGIILEVLILGMGIWILF